MALWAVCVVGFLVAASEIVYRIARGSVCVGRDATTLLEPHPELGWTHRKNASAWVYGCDGREYEFRNQVTINSKGLRDREIAYENPDDALRVLLLGDTLTEAIQVPLERTFAKRMESMLSEEFAPIDVINAGVASYGTDNELLFFRREGLRYGPDLVVLVLTTRNDAIDVSARLHPRTLLARSLPPKSYFSLDTTGELVAPKAGSLLHDDSSSAVETAPGLWASLRARIYALRVLDRLLAGPEPVVAPMRGEAPINWQILYHRPMSEEVVRGWLLVERLVATLHADVREAGAELLVAVMPGREEVAAAELDRDVNGELDFSQANRVARQMLERLGIAYVDLLPPLREYAKTTGDTGFYNVDVHLAPEGHGVVAEELAERVVPILRQRNRK